MRPSVANGSGFIESEPFELIEYCARAGSGALVGEKRREKKEGEEGRTVPCCQ